MKSMNRWKIIIVLFLMLLIFTSNTYASENWIDIVYSNNDQAIQVKKVPIMIDGNILESEIPSYVEKNRTIVPVRVISETLGAEVLWNQALEMVTINKAGKRLDFFIDKNQAKVNGQDVSLDEGSIPKIVRFENSINGHTMLPLSFIVKELGYEVEYDYERGMPVVITKPKLEEVINKVGYPRIEKDQIVIPNGNMKYNKFKLSNPSRIVVDILDSKLDGMENLNKEKNLSYIKGIRAANYNDPKSYGAETDVVRYVFDINENYSQKDVEMLTQGSNLIIKPEIIVEKPEPEKPVIPVNPVKPSNPGKKTIFIDAGHGGRDPGAVAKDGTREKDIALAMSLKAERALKDAGYNVIMTRRDDRYVRFQDVPGIANRSGADLFVSIHANSAGSIVQANGIETLYRPADSGSNKKGNQYPFAASVHNEIIAATGATDRGVKQRRDLAVLNGTTMPAVLLEVGFMSNPAELAKIKTGAYQDIIIGALVRGIDNYCK